MARFSVKWFVAFAALSLLSVAAFAQTAGPSDVFRTPIEAAWAAALAFSLSDWRHVQADTVS